MEKETLYQLVVTSKYGWITLDSCISNDYRYLRGRAYRALRKSDVASVIIFDHHNNSKVYYQKTK